MASRRRPETITCPFNKFHQILPHRIHYHLIKCAKNYPEVEMQICPYNATHLIPKCEDLGAHMAECLDRRIVEVQHYNVPLPGQHGYLRNPTVYGSSLIKIEEIQNQDQEAEAQDKGEADSTMSSLNRSRILRDVLRYRRPNLRDSSPNAGDWSLAKEMQRLEGRDASPASATSSRSTSPTPRPKFLRRPNVVEDDHRYQTNNSRASALSFENLAKTFGSRSSREFSSSPPVTVRASFAHDE